MVTHRDGGAVGVALIGCGLMGAFHARTLASTPFAELVAVVDADGPLAARVAESVGCRVSSGDALDVLADDAVDAVVIASPAATHGSFIEAAAAAGRAVFCEKPLGVSLDEARRAAEAVRQHGVAFQIGFQRRYDPGIARLIHAAGAGELGRVETFRSVTCDPQGPTFEGMSRSAGIFHDTLSHDADLALAIGGPVVAVRALGAAMIDARFAELGKPDTTVVTLRFASGALGVIENRLRTGYGYETVLEVGGSRAKGVVRADELDRLTLYRDGRSERAHVPWFLERFADAYRAELLAFVAAVRSGTPSEPGIDQGLAVLELCVAAEASYREGRDVSLPLDGREVAAGA